MNELTTRIIENTHHFISLYKNRPKKQRIQLLLKNNIDINLESVQNNLKLIYDDGFGLKLIARELGISYTQTRYIMITVLKISIRRGRNIVPERIRKFRSDKAKAEGLGKEWPIKYIRSNKGIQGYYWNRHFNKYCWLRSSYEYIYAKFLDSKNIIWNSEEKYFVLDDGRKYLPDFFIYNNNTLKYVVEIKGNKMYDRGKQDLFKEYPIIIVWDIKKYIKDGSNINKELRLWKQNRLIKLPE